MAKLVYSERQATIHRAVVVSFDLTGFSDFCNQPEPSVANTVPQLIKRTFDTLNQTFSDREDTTSPFITADEVKRENLVEPGIIKCMGDGAIMMWVQPNAEQFPQSFCDLVIQSMRTYQQRLSVQLPLWEKEWRISKLPKTARIGIATGIVYALRAPHMFTGLNDPKDYVGYCINLAVRLQDYSPRVGFMVHANLQSSLPGMENYMAVKLKGSQAEPVTLFKDDLQYISKSDFESKFK